MRLIYADAVEYICRKETVSTNPDDHKHNNQFMDFMDDDAVADFGRWQWANGFNTALVTIQVELKKVPSAQPESKTGRWIETEGLDVEIRCTMCTNPMRSDRGCDGSCQYDEKLYKQIMSIIEDRIDGGGV